MTKLSKKEVECNIKMHLNHFLTAEHARYFILYLKNWPLVHSGAMRPDDSGMSLDELMWSERQLLELFTLVYQIGENSNPRNPIIDLSFTKLESEIHIPKGLIL